MTADRRFHVQPQVVLQSHPARCRSHPGASLRADRHRRRLVASRKIARTRGRRALRKMPEGDAECHSLQQSISHAPSEPVCIHQPVRITSWLLKTPIARDSSLQKCVSVEERDARHVAIGVVASEAVVDVHAHEHRCATLINFIRGCYIYPRKCGRVVVGVSALSCGFGVCLVWLHVSQNTDLGNMESWRSIFV